MDPSVKFEKANGYLEYPLKQMAINFLVTLPDTTGAHLFARDKINADKPGAQIFVVAHPKRIYRRSVCAAINGQPTSYYEWMGGNMKIGDETVKNTIDLDMEGVPQSRPFNNDIVWVVQFVNAAIEARYKIVVHNNQWIVLKCHYDSVKQKYSAHLILHGYMWGTVAARKAFMESIGLVQEFAKRCPEAASPEKVVDAGVFGAKMLRLVKSTKLGKNLPLWPAMLEGFMEPQDSFDFFQKSLGSYTVDCQLLESLDGPPLQALPKIRKPTGSNKSASVCGASTSTIERYAPPVEDLRRVVMGLDKNKRAALHTRDLWTKLGWAVVNIGRVGGYEEEAIEIFREFSTTREEAYREPAFRKVVEDARHDSNLLGWTYIKECHLEDTAVFLGSMSVDDKAQSSSETASGNNSEIQPIVVRDYATVKKEFEKRWFHLKHPTSFVEVTSEDTFYNKLADFKLNEGLIVYEDVESVKGSKKTCERPFLDKWLKDPTKRIYDKEDFLPPPLACPSNVYNLFQGLRAAGLQSTPPDAQVNLQPILDFLAHLCGESHSTVKKGTKYFIDWLANIVQLPGTLPGVAIVIQSPQGTGKNMFASFFGRRVLGGTLFESSARVDTFFSTFAEGLSKKVFVVLNEVEGSMTKKHLGEIKEAITDEKIPYERKNFQRVFIKNFARQLWFTNNTKPVHLEPSDRRFVAFQIENVPDRDYFKQLAAWMADDINVRVFYDFLMARDIAKWDAVGDRPKTAYYTALKRMSLSMLDSWLIHEFEVATLPLKIDFVKILERFNNWASGAYRQFQPMSFTAFADAVKPYQDHGLLKKKGKTCRVFVVDLKALREKFVADDKIDALDSIDFFDDDDD